MPIHMKLPMYQLVNHFTNEREAFQARIHNLLSQMKIGEEFSTN